MNDLEPISTVCDGGRDMTTGRFASGNQCARGNPTPRKTSMFRAKLFRCVSPTDFRDIVRKLVEQAKEGQPWAIKLALQYLVGRAEDVELHQRLMILETTITARDEQ